MKTLLKLRSSPVEPVDLQVNGAEILLKLKSFAFDRVFVNSNAELFADEVEPVLQQVTSERGCHHALVAYGCTSSGKTHTMYNQEDGLLLKSMECLLRRVGDMPGFKVKLRCVEIYMETCKDLLAMSNGDKSKAGPLNLPSTNPARAAMKYLFTPNISSAESSLTRRDVDDLDAFRSIMTEILEYRKISPTGANITSSRSHCLVFIDLFDSDDCLHSCLVFGDLAGSERFKTTMKSDSRHQQEAGSINKSLHVFHNVIHALRENWSHIPIRDSKLTQLLAKSLVGSGHLTLLITVNSDPKFTDETLHVLEFGAIVRQVEPLRSKVDTGLKSNLWNSAKKRLDFGNIVKTFTESPLRKKAPSPAETSHVPVEIPQDWESVVETMVRARENSLRQELILDHSQNSDRLRELYEKIMEETIAETEEKFNHKMDMLAKSYQAELDVLQTTIKTLQEQLQEKADNLIDCECQTDEFVEGSAEYLQEQVESLQKSISEYCHENADLKKECEYANNEAEEKHLMITALEERMVELQNEIDSRKLSFGRNQRFSDILNISPIKDKVVPPAEPMEPIIETLNEDITSVQPAADLETEELIFEKDESMYVESHQENKDNFETADESEAETEFQDANNDMMQLDTTEPKTDDRKPLMNIVTNLENTPMKKEHMSPIFAKLGLKSAFKLRLPSNNQEDKSGKRKRHLRNRSNEENEEQQENNATESLDVGPGIRPVKRKVKLRSKKAIFDSPL